MTNFIDEVLNQFAGDITDKVFLMIQNDPKLMEKYLKLINKSDLNTLNAKIGRAVKEKFNLDNIGKCDKQKSTLIIDSYERHKIKEV